MAANPVVVSTLNPNAPLFVPAAFEEAEDFSPEWWKLVQTSPAFRDYWLEERFEEDSDFLFDSEVFDDYPTIDDMIDQQIAYESEEMESLSSKQGENIPPQSENYAQDYAVFTKIKSLELKNPDKYPTRCCNAARYEKAPKIVAGSPKKLSIRIQQPR